MKMHKTLAVTALAVLVAGAIAQGTTNTGTPGTAGSTTVGGANAGGRRGRQGRGGMMNMPAVQSPAQLLLGGGFGRRGGGGGGGTDTLRDDIYTDIKATDDEKTKIDDLRTKQRDKMREMFQNGGQRPSPEDMAKMMKDANDANNKALAGILSADQMKRLGQIGIQLAGNRAATDADTAKTLGITADQKTKIDDLVTKERDANQQLFQKSQDGEIDRSEVGPKMQANNKILDDEIGKVLTDAQKAKLADLCGPKLVRTGTSN